MSDIQCLSRLPVIDATPFFDRRWGLERTVKEARKRCGLRGPARILIPPRRPGGCYREIRTLDGRRFEEVRLSVYERQPKAPSPLAAAKQRLAKELRQSKAQQRVLAEAEKALDAASRSRVPSAARRLMTEARRLNASTRRLKAATRDVQAAKKAPKKRPKRPDTLLWRDWPPLLGG
jgi:hypothetical protein